MSKVSIDSTDRGVQSTFGERKNNRTLDLRLPKPSANQLELRPGTQSLEIRIRSQSANIAKARPHGAFDPGQSLIGAPGASFGARDVVCDLRLLRSLESL